jgi:hypothetical protein
VYVGDGAAGHVQEEGGERLGDGFADGGDDLWCVYSENRVELDVLHAVHVLGQKQSRQIGRVRICRESLRQVGCTSFRGG